MCVCLDMNFSFKLKIMSFYRLHNKMSIFSIKMHTGDKLKSVYLRFPSESYNKNTRKFCIQKEEVNGIHIFQRNLKSFLFYPFIHIKRKEKYNPGASHINNYKHNLFHTFSLHIYNDCMLYMTRDPPYNIE